MTLLTHTQATALARFVSDVRPEWEFHGVLAVLKRCEESAFTAAQTLINAAADPDANTPGAMTNPVYRPDWSIKADEAKALKDKLRTEELKARRFREEADAARQRAAHPTRIAAIRAAAGYPRSKQ